MFFSFLLWLVAWRIRVKLFFAFRKHPELRSELINDIISIQVETFDEKHIRSYVLAHAKFTSSRQKLDSPSIKVIFPNETTAREVFKALREDKSKIFTFIQEKKMNMEGDFSILQKLFSLKEKLDGSVN